MGRRGVGGRKIELLRSLRRPQVRFTDSDGVGVANSVGICFNRVHAGPYSLAVP